MLAELYLPSLTLLTDLYQLTMACSYWRAGRAEQMAAFNLSFRNCPFHGSYAVAAGLGPAAEWLARFRFSTDDTAWLATLTGSDGSPLFPPDFLAYLGELRFSCNVDAMPEGTLVFPHEPILRVEGPILQCQLVETALLNLINFSTLIATKAARLRTAAGDDPVLEFGLRRAQGPDGSISAARAAYIGGCTATSNVLAGRLLGIPVRGTHAHSWVMSFDSEEEAFEVYADAMPANATFLVDTYNTLEGVRHAIASGKRLRERGYEMNGIRLDSGDLAYLSIEARKLLDEAGFENAKIVASNDLDEELVESLKVQGARIDVWGIGTRLVTGGDQPALGGVYKLGALRRDDGTWEPKIKVSEQMAKSSVPGRLQVRRYTQEDGTLLADAIFEVESPPAGAFRVIDPSDPTRFRDIPDGTPFRDLLVPLIRSGEPVGAPESLAEIRNRVRREVHSVHSTILRLKNPHVYPAGLTEGLARKREEMILETKERSQSK